MTRVGYGDLLKVPNARWGKGAGGVTWLLLDEFTTDDAAPITSPRTCEPGPGTLTLTDPANKFSITGGKLAIAAGASAEPNPSFVADTFARAVGLAMLVTIDRTGGSGVMQTGWTTTSVSDRVLLFSDGSAVVWGSSAVAIASALTNVYKLAVVLDTVGGKLFVNNKLIWVHAILNTANVKPAMFSFSNNSTKTLDDLRVRQLPAPFNTDYGLASQNVASPVSGTSYTATADAITDLTLVAPNPLADQAGYRYRYTDDDNCWHSYFNSAGAYRLDSVAASVATNRINVAAVIAAAGTATMRTISNGSLHDAYTLASTTWTKRGSQINVSHLDTNTAIRPYVTGSWAMSNLRSFPTTDPRYDAELNKT